ncbi:oligosaccharide flippase family protein [Calothrix sp. 336/3]|uniref:oligosaccharide flippase family protein n=1 Tax=Calothrix sp. 336/3 TaxID=1337936 RepID=UPI0004E2B432|nr:oligosaccharide flippase family protein [Calothrix sp. 336/3]AKG22771.1 polysaccharide biosynthesis protein [Calothrix sp. 336/3]
MASLKKLAVRGAAWNIISLGFSYILRFTSNLILTRLLVPEYFGLMAMITTLRCGLELVSDIGISQNIINSKRGDETIFLNTAWTLQVIRGFVIWILCAILAFPVSQFYNDQRLLWLIPIVVLYSVIDGFTSTSIPTLYRHMRLDRLAIYNAILQFVHLSTLIILCWKYPNILVLAIGTVLGGIYRLISSYWLIPKYYNHFDFEIDSAREILSFGKWMFLSSGLMFAAEQADRLVLAKILSFQMLGVYTVAYTLASIPREVIRQVSQNVIFPTISKQADLPREVLRKKIISARFPILIGCGIVLAFFVTVGDLIIASLYDQRYADAIWMMPILCFGIWFSLLFYTISPALLAIRKPLYSAQSNFARFIVIILGVPLAHTHFGVLGAIIVIALSDLPLYIVNLYGLWQEKLFCLYQDLLATIFFIATLAVLLTIRNFLGFTLPISL